MQETSYSLADLTDLAGVTPRTVRYYISQGLLPSPATMGPGAQYTESHLSRLRLIKRMQRGHLPLAEIRSRLAALSDEDVAAVLAEESEAPAESAVDYVRSVLGARGVAPSHMAVFDSAPVPAWLQPAQQSPPDRSSWDRIALTPDIELHVRRPLSRVQNRLVTRLIEIARKLLQEEQP